MEMKDFIIRIIRKTYRIVLNKKFLNPACDLNRQSANYKIYNLLMEDKPCMISRFGTTELITVNNYLCISNNISYIKKLWSYISDNTHTPWWFVDHFYYLNIYSGVFPPTKETSERFAQRYLDDIPLIDLLGSFQYYEKFMPLRSDVVKVQLEMLYPFFVEMPWTRILKGKKVLVVHPFEETIKLQYSKRDKLFDNPEVLPEFELITYKSIQSIAGNDVPFKSWFDALKKMEDDISKIDFEFAIIGCGAYGLPLAAHIKRMGKKAIHIGGGTQLLFGILGKRWVDQYDDILHYRPGVDIEINYRSLFNEHWIYPLDINTPKNSVKVDNACYW